MADRCSAGMARESNTLKCIQPDKVPISYCDEACGQDGGTFNVTDGRCSCKKYTVLSEVCNKTCQLQAPISKLQREKSGKLYLLIIDKNTSKVAEKILQTNEFGINDFDYSERVVEFVDFNSDGNFGVVPSDVNAVSNFLQAPENNSGSRKRRDIDTQLNNAQRIRSPIICVLIGQAVFFKINIDFHNRSLSNYPRYSKNHLFNSNPSFDYGQFRQLNLLIQSTNLSIYTFANVFTEPGVYVFFDNADSRRETIVVVSKEGASCPDRMEASSPLILTRFGIGAKVVYIYIPLIPK